jgi:alpha-aminoadipic semialdehyde synthase
MTTVGIRFEDKYKMEKRVALVPRDVKRLIKNDDIPVIVQKSAKRVFKEEEYAKVGATISDKLDEAQIIFGVKEMPIDFFENNKTYLFFSHTIKGQDYNMPLLKRMVEKKINLIEYEKITDDSGKRLIFFGRYAGLAGMINSFWSFGQRCKIKGVETPFASLKQSHLYSSLDEAKDALSGVADIIKKEGIDSSIAPLVIGITGYGNVSKGAQEIIDLFNNKEITPEELLELRNSNSFDNKTIYKVIFKENHISKPKNNNVEFELQHYYNHPEEYENNFEQYVPALSILMNCMYWGPEYPRIITKDFLEELFSKPENKLCVIGDVTCDPDGSIEATHMGTFIEDPVFVYNPFTREPTMGFEGEGLLIMAVDILPSELPREASEGFSEALSPYVKDLVNTDFNESFEKLTLPAPLKRALILHNGEFTPDYKYMEEFIK